MKGKLAWRWGLICVVTVFAVYFMLPLDKRIHLGLDLKGGIHLVLQVNTQDAVRAEVDDAMVDLVIERWITTGDFHEGLYGFK